jgi:ABC-type polysaccharide/polyol phosphate transport system ATPase subunit
MFDLKFNNVSKRYFLRGGTEPSRRLLRSGLRLRPKAQDGFWALRDVSFEVEQGEAFGIVGHNGAGKSTILKLLSSITAPTRGEITIRGRLSALVELGSGFHPELTGRENIYLNGAILGMTRSEITDKVDSIIEFSGVREHIDVPMKKYSSGMYVRLGFAIAAHLDPDILLLDEVLAVGDVAFQAKCLDRLSELRGAGRTIVLITHDLAALARLCDRAILLETGRIVLTGSPRKVIDAYLTRGFASQESFSNGGPTAEKLAECRGISFIAGDSSASIRTGYPMIARVAYHASKTLANVAFRLSIYWPSGYLCSELVTTSTHAQVDIRSGLGVIEFYCPVLPFQPGLYRVGIVLESNGNVIDRREHCATLRVDPGKLMAGDFYFDHTWQIIEQESEPAQRTEWLGKRRI